MFFNAHSLTSLILIKGSSPLKRKLSNKNSGLVSCLNSRPSRNLLSCISKVFLSPHKTCAHYTSFGEWNTKFLPFQLLICYNIAVLRLADYFGDMEIYIIFTGARSLIIMMNVSQTASLKLDVIVLPPCYLEQIIPVIFAQNNYMHQKLFWGAPNAKFSLPWEQYCLGDWWDTPSQTLPLLIASLPRSSPRSLLSATWKYRMSQKKIQSDFPHQ